MTGSRLARRLSTNFHTDPVRRGRWIRVQILGGCVPDMPINAAA